MILIRVHARKMPSGKLQPFVENLWKNAYGIVRLSLMWSISLMKNSSLKTWGALRYSWEFHHLVQPKHISHSFIISCQGRWCSGWMDGSHDSFDSRCMRWFSNWFTRKWRMWMRIDLRQKAIIIVIVFLNNHKNCFYDSAAVFIKLWALFFTFFAIWMQEYNANVVNSSCVHLCSTNAVPIQYKCNSICSTNASWLLVYFVSILLP